MRISFFNAPNAWEPDAVGSFRSFFKFWIVTADLRMAHTHTAPKTYSCLAVIAICFAVTFPFLTASYFNTATLQTVC